MRERERGYKEKVEREGEYWKGERGQKKKRY
jgi:hypothetical protein